MLVLGPAALIGDEPGWAARLTGKRAYYVLDPEWSHARRCNKSEARKPDDCHGCKACHKHAKNKIFPSRRAANRGRAHPGCKCRVVKGGTLDADIWADLFKAGSRTRRSVDRRKKRTRRVLRRSRLRALRRRRRRLARRNR